PMNGLYAYVIATPAAYMGSARARTPFNVAVRRRDQATRYPNASGTMSSAPNGPKYEMSSFARPFSKKNEPASRRGSPALRESAVAGASTVRSLRASGGRY